MPEIRSGNPINNQEQKPVGSRSNFNLSHRLAQTARFGEITPFLAMETVPSDSIKVRANHNLSTFTLKSPMLQNLSLKKDYFNVPMEAILPLNWEKIYTNPVKGDDVLSDVNCLLNPASLFTDLKAGMTLLHSTWRPPTSGATANDYKSYFEQLFGLMLIFEAFYSKGSLLTNLGYGLHGSVALEDKTPGLSSAEKYDVDTIISEILDDFQDKIDNNANGIYIDFSFPEIEPSLFFRVGNYYSTGSTYYKTNIRAIFALLRTGTPWDIADIGFDPNGSGTWNGDWYPFTTLPYNKFRVPYSCDLGADTELNMARPYAYQLVHAHFYTDDKIDFVYSAELFRQNVNYLVNVLGETKPTFSYNGMQTDYDVLSEKYVQATIKEYVNNGWSSLFKYGAYYVLTLFGFRNSLRYSDFFTGAKSQPVAVGDLSVDVNSGTPNYVSVLDVTRGIQMQRFLTAVNRAGARFSNYIKGLFGTQIAYDYHNPMYLGHTGDVIYPSETQNTGADQLTQQQSITSVLGSNSGKFAFEFHSDRPSVLLGVMYFDIERFYAYATDPQNFMKDRFDMFNPFLQYIGDQPLNGLVLSMKEPPYASGFSRAVTFGYQQKDMAYKQSFSRCAGGFINQLPSYIFQSDNDNPMLTPLHITPLYLRSMPFEFDSYYVSLTGKSLDAYFHFIIMHDLEIEASRPMAYNPSIL